MTETTTTPEVETTEASLATEQAAVSEQATERQDRPRSRGRGDRKPRRNDRRGGIREEVKEFQEEILAIDRVTRVTAGGRQLRFRVSLVIGDGKGRVGLGIGKSGEVQGAIEKALRDARKNLIHVEIVNGTIAHNVSANYKSSAIFLHPAHPGTGIIAGGAARKVFAVSGIKDVIAKQHGAPNRITNTRVTLKALQAIKPQDKVRNFARKDVTAAEGVEEKKTEKKMTTRKTTKKSAE